MGSPAWRQRRTSVRLPTHNKQAWKKAPGQTKLPLDHQTIRPTNVCIKQMFHGRSDLTRWRPLWCWWSGTGLARRTTLHSGMPPRMTGPPARPRGAVRWAVATIGSRWSWRPRPGGWSLVVGRKGRRGSLTMPQMNLQEERVLQESKSPAQCKEKRTQISDILIDNIPCKK